MYYHESKQDRLCDRPIATPKKEQHRKGRNGQERDLKYVIRESDLAGPPMGTKD
jgi:hypothetical protein